MTRWQHWALLVAMSALPLATLAGGPEIQLDQATIDDVTIDHRGVVLTVSGAAKLFVPKVKGDDPEGGNAKWITLPAKGTQIRHLGSVIDTVSASSQAAYEKRLKALKGTRQLLQLWGTTATVEAGHLSHVSARDVNVLRPVKKERRFDSDRLLKSDTD